MKICILVDNNVIKGYGIIENDIKPFEDGIEIETDLDLDTIDLVNNYKLIDGQLVELTETEKASLVPAQEPTIEERLASAEEMLTMLMGV